MNKSVNKKQKLLLRKVELINELKYYEARIQDALTSSKSSSCYEDDSSDSEIEFTINAGISVTELKLEKSQLQTCLRATQELTGVTILQSEVNVLVNAPTFEGEAPITEEGLWREVMAECKIDLVPFSITFYTHQPSRGFAPASYRGLHVMPIKLVHERELARSVLATLAAPSDAIEVVRSYAQAHRARRASLARLAELYADSLFMEAAPEGGYVLKCADLLQASWTLQNKWSPVAPFIHKMSFELEFMDESYVKTITQAHKQLCDPSLDTDDRTLLLAKIIDACLDARKQIGPSNIDSDVDSQNSKRQTSDQEMDIPVIASEIMGPPKSLPKKTKPKGKENIAVTHERKRANDVIGKTEVATKKAETGALNANSKNAIDKNSDISDTNKEEAVKAAQLHKTKAENVDKKTKNIQKSKDNEITEPTDALKTKVTLQAKSNSESTKNDDKSTENNSAPAKNKNLEITENKKNPEKKLKSKERKGNNAASKVISTEKESNNVNVEQENVAIVPATQNKNIQSKATKNRKTKASVDENEPKSKKSKTSIPETNKNIASNSENVNTTDMAAPKSKEKMVNEKVETENTKQNVVKNPKLAKKPETVSTHHQAKKSNEEMNRNVELEKNKQIADNNPKSAKEQSDQPEINKDLKTNRNNKNIPNKVSLTKSSNTTNTKKNSVQKSTNMQTLSERFSSKNKIEPPSNVAKSNKQTFSKDSNKEFIQKNQPTNNLIETNVKSSKNEKQINQKVINLKSDNVLTSKLSSKNKQLNKNNIPEHVNVKTDKKPKTKSNNSQKPRKSLGGVKKAVPKKYMNVENKLKSKIPQKKLSISKNVMNNPLRISPRKHLFALSTTQDSSKNSTSSLQKQTNIPRFLKKPNVKIN